MKNKCLYLFLLLLSFSSFACLNGETKILKNGFLVYEDYEGIVPHGHIFHHDSYQTILKELDSLYAKTGDLDYLSDKGYLLVVQKKYNEALSLYLSIEKREPNRYSTASNVGTIYELLGDNQMALFWIRKAMQINAASHKSSEWIHIKILEAKIGGGQLVNSNFLIGTSFGNGDEPKSSLTKKQREKLIQSLYFQLNERVTFIKTEDPIMGQLLFDLGNLAFLNKKYKEAQLIYLKAITYGYKGELLSKRIQAIEWKINDDLYSKNSQLASINSYHKTLFVITLAIGSVTILILSFLFFRLRKKRLGEVKP